MNTDASSLPGEMLRQAMRRWVAGVTVVTARHDARRYGMTVNSFSSVSLDPPVVTVTLANTTHTRALVEASGRFGVNILREEQQEISDIFAGRVPEHGDRFAGLDWFTLVSEVPFLSGCLAALDCRVIHHYAMPNSTLYVGQVEAVQLGEEGRGLVYFNRAYHRGCG